MFSLSNIIRMYIVLSIVVLIGFFVVLTSLDVLFAPYFGTIPRYIQTIYQNLYIAVIIISLATVVCGSLVLMFVLNRGLYKYQDLLSRFGVNRHFNAFNASSIKFPEKDEFGNLGFYLNKFLSKIERYDQIKTKLANIEKEKFELVSEACEYPILLIDTKGYEPYLCYHNQSFKDFFLKKNMYIDNSGRMNVQYYKVLDMPVINFHIQNESNEPFLHQIQLTQLRHNTILWEKKHTMTNLVFKELSGDKQYQFEKVISIPLNNDYEGIMTQMLYIFIGGTEIENKLIESESSMSQT